MADLDLRNQWKLTKRALLLVIPIMAAIVASDSASIMAATGFRSALAGGFFVLTVGSVVLAIAIGLAVPRIWMNSSPRERQLHIQATTGLNVLGWAHLGYLFATL